jgi:hypothetical protein
LSRTLDEMSAAGETLPRDLSRGATTSDDHGSPAGWRGFATGYARRIIATMAAGIVSGAIVGGIGSRVVMRVLAITSAPQATGILTENGNRVGEITTAGTIALITAGVAIGMLGALTWLVTRRWIPGRRWGKGLLFGFVLLCLGGGFLIDPKNADFAHLRPASLAVMMFALLFPLFGLLFVPLAERWAGGYPILQFRPGPVLAYGIPMFFLVLAFPALIGLAVFGVLGWNIQRSERLPRIWMSKKVQILGDAVLLIACGFGSFRLISGVLDIV